MTTHDYPTRNVLGSDLDGEMVLVGESGGLSAIYETKGSSAMPGLITVDTEHGPLYLDPDEEYLVYDYDNEGGYTEPQAMFIRGNLSDGFEAVGPYPSMDEAANAHDMQEGWLITLTPPEKDPESLKRDPDIEVVVTMNDGTNAMWILDDVTWNAVEKVLGTPDSQRI